MSKRCLIVALVVLSLSALVSAQDPTEPIANWTAPPYWTMPAGGQVREQLTGSEVSLGNQGASTESTSSTSPILPFTAITPCRLVDTRQSPDTPYLDNGGSGETRTYHFDTTIPYTGTGACSVLPTAAALSLSVQFQVTDHQASLIAYPDDVTRPLVASVVAYNTGLFYMNSAIVPTGADGGIKVFAQWGGQVVININGYYAPSNIVTTLNTKTGDVALAAGSNVDISPSGNTLTISMTGAPGGTLPAGTSGQTLFSNGSGWVASSVLTNDGSANVVVMGDFGASGKLKLPSTTSSTSGVITFGGTPFIHNYAGAGTEGHNTFVGQGAGNFAMGGGGPFGSNNTAAGSLSLAANTSGEYNTATGAYSLYSNTTGVNNTASGGYCLYANTEGSGNTASGIASLRFNTTGAENTAVGDMSLYGNTTAGRNTAVGSGALQTQSYDSGTGPWDSYNTAVGYWALYSNRPTATANGISNTAIGAESLAANGAGYQNTAAGRESLHFNGIGYGNTASGYQSMYTNTYGNYNTASGHQSLYTSVGSYNIALGYQAGYNLTNGNYNIDIGSSGLAGESGTIRIGGSNHTRAFIAGISGVNVGTASAVYVNSAGQLGTATSSLRFKQDVADMGDASSRLLDLRPVTFRYRAQPDGARHFGLIAEEVNEVMPELVVRDATGQPETVAYHELPAMLLNELQKQRASIQAQMVDQAKTIRAQQARVEGLSAQLAAERARNGSLEARLAALEARLAAK